MKTAKYVYYINAIVIAYLSTLLDPIITGLTVTELAAIYSHVVETM